MMSSNEIVTIFSFDKAKGEFVKKGTFPAWVRRMRRLRNSKRGTYFCDNFDVRIALELVEEIDAGDLVFFGKPEDGEIRLDKCRKVAVVSKNAYGINPHWHLEAEYEYR